MSSDKTAFGTQSPPLEATGQEEPLGVSDASGTKPKAVPDSEQRQRKWSSHDSTSPSLEWID